MEDSYLSFCRSYQRSQLWEAVKGELHRRQQEFTKTRAVRLSCPRFSAIHVCEVNIVRRYSHDPAESTVTWLTERGES